MFLSFLKNIYGTIQKPHATYLRLSNLGGYRDIFFIWILVFLSLAWTMAVKVGVFKNPMFFAVNLTTFAILAFISYFFVCLLIYFLGRFWGEKGELKKIMVLWAFSYLPTMVWFMGISAIFIFFPPPRTFSLKGYALSAVLIGFSGVLFYWKLILYYLTLRIGFKITWGKIIKISLIFFPIMVIYSYLLYKLGIFKVPFI